MLYHKESKSHAHHMINRIQGLNWQLAGYIRIFLLTSAPVSTRIVLVSPADHFLKLCQYQSVTIDLTGPLCFTADTSPVRGWPRNPKGAQNGGMVAQISLEDSPLACRSVGWVLLGILVWANCFHIALDWATYVEDIMYRQHLAEFYSFLFPFPPPKCNARRFIGFYSETSSSGKP